MIHLGKISICSDKMESSCHRKNRSVFQLMKKVTFRRILTFCSSRKWGCFGGICGRLSALLIGWWDLSLYLSVFMQH